MSSIQQPADLHHVPRGWRVRYSLATLFLLTTAAACCLGCPLALVRFLEGGDLIGTLYCGHGRRVEVVVPSFPDAPGIPVGGNVYDGFRRVGRTGFFIYTGGEYPSPSSFRSLSLDDGDLIAVFSDYHERDEPHQWELHFLYRFSSRAMLNGYHERPSPEIVERAWKVFVKEHPDLPVDPERQLSDSD